MNEEQDKQEFYLKLKKAEKKIQKIIIKWFMEDPMMLEALNMFKKVKEEDVIISRNASYGNKYNEVVDRIWYKIKKRKK